MTTDNLLPLGQKPEGELDVMDKLEKAKDKLFASIDILQENIKKLTEENKRLKEALGLTETLEPLVLTEEMEVKPLDDLRKVINGHK
jgi:cell shape-determining protein MreC